jgi:hypothetical protein
MEGEREMRNIIMRTPAKVFEIELNDSDTANAIWLALPLEAYINVWGDEIYFEIPVETGLENGRSLMEVGEVAYWPSGKAFCLFFGPTPASKDGTPTAISDVSPVGRVLGDPTHLREVGDRSKVILERS